MKAMGWSIALAALVALTGCDDGVKVSQFGYDPEDSTEIIQKALDSGLPKLVFDRQKGPWITRPLEVRSNQELVFEEGVVLQAKRGEFKGRYIPLMSVVSVTNVTIRGLGKGATFRMWKEDYQDPAQYEKSEWRHTLRLSGAVNVLVENMTFTRSGGDGICLGRNRGVSCENVTIRRCVCDENHRQGISACAFDGLVIEDCVLSNTKGTPPQAGIDIEPNTWDEPICNLVMRNVRSFGNAGSGFEVMLHHGTQASRPVSLRFEDCYSSNNNCGTVVVGNHVRDYDIVRGDVEFVNCSFEADRSRAIRITGVPKNTLNVGFRDCTVTGNGKSRAADVIITTLGAMQGLPDRVAFDNLVVNKRNGADWFSFSGCGVGPAPSSIRGTVEVRGTNGAVERVTLDGKWVRERFRTVSGGRLPPPMKPIPGFGAVKAVDLRPGELVDLAPVATASYARNYLLLVEKPGKVRLVARTTGGKKGDPAKNVEIRRILPDGKRGVVARVPMPGTEGGEISFKVQQCPGIYTVTLPSGGAPSVIEKSNVPIALDLTGWSPLVTPLKRQPYAFHFYVPGGSRFAAYASGDAFAAEFRDPSGQVVAKDDTAGDGVAIVDVPAAEAKEGLWSMNVSAIPKGGFSQARMGIGNLPGYFFLSNEKYWK